MKRLLSQMKLHGAMASRPDNTSTRWGIVTGYDPDSYCCKVLLKPEDAMTGWLPISSPWVGNGWGMFAPPSIGETVDVHFQEGNIDAGYVQQRFFNDDTRPVHSESGVFYLIHKSGSAIKFNNDGTVDIVVHTQLNITSGAETHLTATKFVVNAPMQVNNIVTTTGKITGGADIQATTNVSDQAGAKTMNGMRTTFNSHTHPENGTGGGTTSVTTTGM